MQKKTRLVMYSVYALFFIMYVLFVRTTDYLTENQETTLFSLILYCGLAFVIMGLGEMFNANEKSSPQKRKYFFNILIIVWIVFLFVLFGDIILLFLENEFSIN